MIKLFVYRNTMTRKVLKVTTLPLQYSNSGPEEEWVVLNYSEEDEYSYNIHGLKWALPNQSCFDGLKFTPDFPYSISPEEYNSIVREEFSNLRAFRDSLLNRSDWTQLPDAPLSTEKKQEWVIYRQKLRDLPNTTVNPYVVFWPSVPS